MAVEYLGRSRLAAFGTGVAIVISQLLFTADADARQSDAETARTVSSLDRPEARHEALFDEYRNATVETLNCMRAAGLVVAGPRLSTGGRFLEYYYETIVTSPTEMARAERAADVEHEKCRNRHLDLVERRYLEATDLSDQEANIVAADFADCLREAGLHDLRTRAVLAEIVAALAAAKGSAEDNVGVDACVSRYQDAFLVSSNHPEG